MKNIQFAFGKIDILATGTVPYVMVIKLKFNSRKLFFQISFFFNTPSTINTNQSTTNRGKKLHFWS